MGLSARILPAHQRKGYLKEAAPVVVGHGFMFCKLQEIGIYASKGNSASCSAVEMLGIADYGARESYHPFVSWAGSVLYRISLADWQTKKLEKNR